EDLITRGRSGDFDSLSDYNEEFAALIGELSHKMRKAANEARIEARDFGNDYDSLFLAAAQTLENRKKPQNFIKTGIKMLNEMLGGGFEQGRTYVFIGPSGG